jgi:3-oxoacyl-[acyl-carrier protein] reductase
MNEQVLQGRTAIVTGSGQNIGKAIARMFAAAGANVVVNGRSNQKLVDETVDEINNEGGSAVGIMADVSDHAAVNEMVAETKRRFGTVDIAVNNVSIRRKQPFLEITPQDWDDTLRVNLTSCYYLTQAVIPLMMENKWGRLIMMSGIDGWAEMRKKQVPSGQLGHVDDIAQACLYLAGPNSGFTTGQVIHVNGGLYMY